MRMPVLRFKADDGAGCPDWKEKTLSEIAKRVTRKNKDNQTDIPLTISSLDGLVDQRDYFKKTVASKDMSGYFLLQNGEFAYNKSYSVGFDYGSIKRLDKYPCGALSTLYICFGLKPNVGIDSDYLTHYFDSQKWNPEVAAICAEGARNHGLLNVPTADFFDIGIDVPPFPNSARLLTCSQPSTLLSLPSKPRWTHGNSARRVRCRSCSVRRSDLRLTTGPIFLIGRANRSLTFLRV